MDLTKMQYENVTLAEITPDDEDELLCIARLTDDEGIQHGDWLARSQTADDEQLEMLQNGVDPTTGKPYSDEDRLNDIMETINDLLEDHYEKQRIKIWKIFSDDEPAGYMVYMGCYGSAYLHFLMLEDFSDIETKADIMSQSIMAAIPFLDYYFHTLETRDNEMRSYPFHEVVEDLEFSLGLLGFRQHEELDYYDYKRLARFGLNRNAFEALKNSLEY